MAEIVFDSVSKRFPDGTLAVDDLDLHVGDGEFLILVGPSGCGKTTTLRMLAGLDKVTGGEILINGRPVSRVDPRQRGLAMIFQSYALYPHMTVEQNIGFPVKMADKLPKKEVAERVREVVRLLDLEDQVKKRPSELSGGQRQRVAMGRAIVRRPVAFLMDEPLSNLDAKLRTQMRAELLELHQRLRVTTIYVTHDQTEAMTLGERVVVMNKGVLQQVAPPQEMYSRPANLFVADFIGSPSMSFLPGELASGSVRIGGRSLPLPDAVTRRVLPDGPVLVGVRPEHFRLCRRGEAARAVHAMPAKVKVSETVGPEHLMYFRLQDVGAVDIGDETRQDLRDVCVARLDAEIGLEEIAAGRDIAVTIDLAHAQLFERGTGVNLLAEAAAPPAAVVPA